MPAPTHKGVPRVSRVSRPYSSSLSAQKSFVRYNSKMYRKTGSRVYLERIKERAPRARFLREVGPQRVAVIRLEEMAILKTR